MVVLYFKANEQRHYTGHSNEVTAVAVSPSGLVASSERSSPPEIHIWEIESKKRLHQFIGLHQTEIYKLKFIQGDRYLLSCGKRARSTVVISDLFNEGVHISTCMEFFVRNVVTLTSGLGELRHIKREREKHETTFYMFGKDRFIKNNCNEFNFRAKQSIIAGKVDEEIGAINAALFLIYNDKRFTTSTIASKPLVKTDPQSVALSLLSGHQDGKVIVWRIQADDVHFEQVVKEYKYPVVQIEFVSTGVGIATDDAIINIWDVSMQTCTRSFDLSQLPFKLQSLKIKNMIWAKDKLLVTTFSGDFIQLNMDLRKELKKGSFVYSIHGKKFKNVFKLNKIVTSCLLLRKKNVNDNHFRSMRISSQTSLYLEVILPK